MDAVRDDAEVPILEARRRPRPKLAIAPLLVLILLVNLSASLYQLPLNRIIEKRLCRDYYNIHDPSVINSDGNVDEKLCKIDDVQKSLAWVVGIMETLWIVGDFVMTIPLGFVAEKYGRRTVLWLNIVPRLFLLAWVVTVGFFEKGLPLKAIIVGPCLSILGGNCVLNSIVYALAASLTDDNVVRATYFSWTNAISYVVTFVGPGLAGATMTLNLFLPLLIGICLLLLAIPTISLLADPTHNSPASEDEQRRPLISSPTLKAQSSSGSILKPIIKRFHTLRSIVRSHPRNLSLLLISFFFTSLASSDTTLLAQFISKRYHWEFASAGYLLSAKAVVNFTLLTFVIPGVLRARGAQGPNQPPTLSDWDNVKYSRICLVLSEIGALAIALSITPSLLFPSLLVYSLGSALPVFTLGLLKSPSVAPKDEDRSTNSTEPETHIFSIVMMVKILGSLVGAPLMAAIWVKGISTGVYGIPYYTSAFLYACASVVFLGLKVQRGR